VYVQQTPQYAHKTQIIHLVMANINSPMAKLNEHVYNYINSQLATTNRYRDVQMHGPIGELVLFLKDQMKNYILLDDKKPAFEIDPFEKKLRILLGEDDVQTECRINPSFPKFFSFAQSGYNYPMLTKTQMMEENYVPEAHILTDGTQGVRFLFEVALLKYDSVNFKLFTIEDQIGTYEVQLKAKRFLEKIEMEYPNSEFLMKGDWHANVSWTGQANAQQELDLDSDRVTTIYEHGILNVFVPFKGTTLT